MSNKQSFALRFGRALLGLVMVSALVLTIVWAAKKSGEEAPGPTLTSDNGAVSEAEPTTQVPVVTEPYVVSRATVASTGDILIHTPLLSSAKQGDGSYDFSYIFPRIQSYFESYDYTAANLEVPLGGEEAGAYDGYPSFNSPDSLATALKNAGVDMLLTANNHSADQGGKALMRTNSVVRAAGLDTLGTRASQEEGLYTVKEINGVPIGMACYTYGRINDKGNKSLNGGGWLSDEVSPLINVFDYDKLDSFYAEAESVVNGMMADGAAVKVIYVHWGDEYHYTAPNSWQQKIAQKLCDLGYDLIIGGHPHVVQPVETLTGVNGNETFCVYSMGNAVSNQRRERMTSEPTGHTEDGMIFTFTVEQWSDGSYRLSDLIILPTWVNKYLVGGRYTFEIVPLDVSVADWTQFGLSDPAPAKASFNRTMEIVGEGLNAYRTAHGLPEAVTHVD